MRPFALVHPPARSLAAEMALVCPGLHRRGQGRRIFGRRASGRRGRAKEHSPQSSGRCVCPFVAGGAGVRRLRLGAASARWQNASAFTKILRGSVAAQSERTHTAGWCSGARLLWSLVACPWDRRVWLARNGGRKGWYGLAHRVTRGRVLIDGCQSCGAPGTGSYMWTSRPREVAERQHSPTAEPRAIITTQCLTIRLAGTQSAYEQPSDGAKRFAPCLRSNTRRGPARLSTAHT